MDAQNVTDLETMERIVWSTTRLYLSLLETFPKYVEDFQAKWNDWQQAISADEFVPPQSSIYSRSNLLPTAYQLGPRSPPSQP
jgi:hypothetical protein